MSDNVVKYKRPFSLNIGLIIFILIIVYVIFSFYFYLTKKSVSEYEVTQGSIASNTVYTGLAIRNEKVIYADQAGYINYYEPNATKVSVHDLIYSIDLEGTISKSMETSEMNGLSDASLKEISLSVDSFMKGYSSKSFSSVVQYKEDLSTDVAQAINNQMMINYSDQIAQAVSNDTFIKGYAEQPGVIMYYTDGYEGITGDTYSIKDFDVSNYKKNHLSNREEVSLQDALYKIILDEEWHLVFPIDDGMANKLADSSSVKIRFCEDDFRTSASYSIQKQQGQFFLDLKLQKGMIRYANERFIDVELIINEKSGLKIPNSAITTKDFYTVPSEYFVKGGDSNSLGLLVKKQETNEYVFVAPTIYYDKDGEYYYIDSEFVTDGDVVQKPGESSSLYIIGDEIDELTGVYNINKGYAVFKQINIIYQNEEYAIVEQKTTYGVALYDHIALDASMLSENELIVK